MLPTHPEFFPELAEGAPGRTPTRELGAQRVLLPNRCQMAVSGERP